MLKKMVPLIVAVSFLFIITVPVHSNNHDQGIQPLVQHGGA